MRSRFAILALATLCLTLVTEATAQSATIITVAGGGPNGGPALEVNLIAVSRLALDTSGNIYIANENRVFRMDGAGFLTKVAGQGVAGFSGDGGPATAATLSNVRGLAVDGAGNLFVSDTSNNRIRRVDAATGVITTIAGTGIAGFNGDGIPAVSANLNYPSGLALDATGGLIVAESLNYRVRRVDLSSGIITTIAGTGGVFFNGDGIPAVNATVAPNDVVLDAAGNLLIAEGSGRIRRVSATTGLISTVAGGGTSGLGDGGPATSARLSFPGGVEVDSAGNIYIADSNNQRVRKVDTTGTIRTYAGTGILGGPYNGDGIPALSANIGFPVDVLLDASGNLLFTDPSGSRVRRVNTSTGIISTAVGNGSCCSSGDGGPATDASIGAPRGLAVSTSGDFFIADGDSSQVRRVDATTGVITTELPPPPATLGVAYDGPGVLIMLRGCTVQRLDLATLAIATLAGNGTCGFSGDGGSAVAASIDGQRLAVDSHHNIYISDLNSSRVRRVSATGIITTAVAGISPWDIALDSHGNLFIPDVLHALVFRVDAQQGTISTVAGNGTFTYSGDGGPATAAGMEPFGVALGAKDDLFIADRTNNRVRRVDSTTRIITTYAGNGLTGSGGDGAEATLASLAHPVILASGPGDTLYIGQGFDYRIRRVEPTAGGGNLVTLAPAELWPPNHRMVEVTAEITATSTCAAPVATLLSVTSSEPDDATGTGDGETTEDIQGAEIGTGDLVFSLRAERDAQGSGRLYIAVYSIRCRSGAVIETAAAVSVPHDRAGVTEPVSVSTEETPSGTLLSWAEVPGASGYDVVRGDVAAVHVTPSAIDLGDLTCLGASMTALSTAGSEDSSVPAPGTAFFYLVEYQLQSWRGLGTESTPKPQTPHSGDCH